jgi:hypothetical protein
VRSSKFTFATPRHWRATVLLKGGTENLQQGGLILELRQMYPLLPTEPYKRKEKKTKKSVFT